MPPDDHLPFGIVDTIDTEGLRKEGLTIEPRTAKTIQPWPEDAIGGNLLTRLYIEFQKWTFSYMTTLLRAGSRQTSEEGTSLSGDDLFAVPKSMKAEYLVAEFK